MVDARPVLDLTHVLEFDGSIPPGAAQFVGFYPKGGMFVRVYSIDDPMTSAMRLCLALFGGEAEESCLELEFDVCFLRHEVRRNILFDANLYCPGDHGVALWEALWEQAIAEDAQIAFDPQPDGSAILILWALDQKFDLELSPEVVKRYFVPA